jgi:2-oxo-3-hexenedioate decarboxylase
MNPEAAGQLLRTARVTRHLVDPITDTHPDLDEDWGYQTQAIDRDHRVRSGEIVTGAKLGLTSRAKQERMSIDRPIVGFLTDAMLVDPDDLAARLDGWVQPRIEPEIAFITSRVIDGSLEVADVPSFVASVLLAAEILDSRFVGYRFRLPDVIADNTSAAGVVLAPERHHLAELGDLATLPCEVRVDGTVVHQASGAAILGEPLRALVLLADHLARRGQSLPAGSLVLAGALTDAEPLETGRRYELSIGGLGTLRLAP